MRDAGQTFILSSVIVHQSLPPQHEHARCDLNETGKPKTHKRSIILASAAAHRDVITQICGFPPSEPPGRGTSGNSNLQRLLTTRPPGLPTQQQKGRGKQLHLPVSSIPLHPSPLFSSHVCYQNIRNHRGMYHVCLCVGLVAPALLCEGGVASLGNVYPAEAM